MKDNYQTLADRKRIIPLDVASEIRETYHSLQTEKEKYQYVSRLCFAMRLSRAVVMRTIRRGKTLKEINKSIDDSLRKTSSRDPNGVVEINEKDFFTEQNPDLPLNKW